MCPPRPQGAFSRPSLVAKPPPTFPAAPSLFLPGLCVQDKGANAARKGTLTAEAERGVRKAMWKSALSLGSWGLLSGAPGWWVLLLGGFSSPDNERGVFCSQSGF